MRNEAKTYKREIKQEQIVLVIVKIEYLQYNKKCIC